MRLQALLAGWGGCWWLGVQQRRAPSLGWQAHRRSGGRLVLAGAASGGGSPEQPIAPRPASGAQQQPELQPPPDPWERACQQVAAFQRQHGRLPRVSSDALGPLLPDERPLALWCTQQQRRKAGSKGPPLTAQERAALLAIPGWGWWAIKWVMVPWEQRREEVEAFYQQHGRLPRISAGKASPFLPGERELGSWVNRQRQFYNGKKQPLLTAERVEALEATPGWVWEDRIPWELRYQQVQDFARQHGRLPREDASTSNPLLQGERELGTWCSRQRQRLKGREDCSPLSGEQQAALTALPGWFWDLEEVNCDRWEQQRQEVGSFYQQHGRLPRKSAGKPSPFLPGERDLGRWVHNQRQCYRGNSQPPLSAERLAALEATPGWEWDYLTPWEQRYQQVLDFVRQHGRLPRATATKSNPLLPGEKELGAWCSTQRQRFKGQGQYAPLTAARQAALVALPGWYWDTGDDRWEKQRQKL